MERVRPLVSDTLSPQHKFHVKQTLMEVLVTSITKDTANVVDLMHWYIADVLTAASTKKQLYHLLPKPLHQFVDEYVTNPQEDEPAEALELKQKHAEAMEHIHIRLTEKLLEE
ncbi:hypothetical protein HYP06_gp048 [Vibrio phage vB_VspP_pVa5]|uniref:Uncharacterized protein n=1 Tax=Vibrio phage vB_VspP_pVa5 TaxID=1913109 RepID=A0A1J0GV63_9CAUD|nr:hypothetical protein HYP06_gp048 [Vibrio phage vB_VspP_pVa5]APC46071.1 hypothetical protein vBVspPpVa5_0048 [Vibrio phage vB_VspP_pVa5]